MPRFLLVLIAAIAGVLMATPAAAATGSWPATTSWSTAMGLDEGGFAQAPLGDEELGAIHGTGMDDGQFMKRASSDHAEAYGRQTAGGLSVAFDNWLADVAEPLIISNLAAP